MSCVGWFYCIYILLWLSGGFAYHLAAEGKGGFVMVRMMYITRDLNLYLGE